MAEQAVALLPDEPEAKLALAAALHDQTEYAAAAALYRQVLSRQPRHAGALSSLGNTLRALGHTEASLAAHDRAIAAAPANPEYAFNRATALLAAGDYAQGWPEYEARWLHPPGRVRALGPAWTGEPIEGRTILLHAEQGLGDTLQFVRYVPLVAALGARIVLEVQPQLVRYLSALPGAATVIARGDPLPPYDAHCPLLSLPRAFPGTIPADFPYLPMPPQARAANKRVGLAWAGSPHTNDGPAHLVDLRRSIDPALLSPLAALPGIEFVSLQLASTTRPDIPLTDPMTSVKDFADTAAIVADLDLVITVDTSIAHLAGGLGVPVWLMNRHAGCWRWQHARTDTPWYPNMRIYRQPRPLDWAPVVRAIARDLKPWYTQA
jgi:hypothetical protein